MSTPTPPDLEARPQLDVAALPTIEEGSPLAAEWWLASGHLRSTQDEAFLSVVTVISIVGVTVGVALLNCVLAVMTGFEKDLRDKILGANAHIVVMRFGGGMEATDELLSEIEGIEGVTHAAPFIYSEMMVRSRTGTSGIIFKGIDPHRTGGVTDVRDQLESSIQGQLTTDEAREALFLAMAEPFPGGGPDDDPLPGLILGDELADDLLVVPGDKVQVINPLGSGSGLFGMPTPTVRSFRVAGTFHSGMYEYDTKWSYASIPHAQDFLKSGDVVTGVEVRVEEIDDVEEIAKNIDDALEYPNFTRHWRNLNQALFEALELEKVVMSLVLGMVIVVAGLLIVSNLYTLTITKRREIAILKAMGASSNSILRVFLMVGGVIGIVGTTAGTALGLLGCWILDAYEYPLETDVYYVSSLPVVVEWPNVMIIAVVAFVICFLSTLYPAWRAASVDPVDGLRYE